MPALVPLAIGFALKGRDARVRAALIAVASGLAVALLLLAVSVPHALAERASRASGWNVVSASKSGDGALRYTTVDLVDDAGAVSGALARPVGAHPPLPPGVANLPADRSMVVSPALAALLAAPDGALLRARLPYRVVGEIAPAGLLGPGDLRFFAVDSRFDGGSTENWVVGFGHAPAPEPLDPVLALLVVVGVAVLLLPVAVVVAIAGRYGSERRDRRLAALRLLGVGRRGVVALALLEALVAALLGDAVGLAVFLVAREALRGLRVASLSVFPSDVVPPLPAALAVLLVMPALLALAALAGMRGVAIEPLGVARRGRAGRRRLWWRIAPLVLAVPLLLLGAPRGTDGAQSTTTVATGAVLLLLGALALLPWLTERIARGAAGRGSLSWQLALRRAGHEGSTTARVVGAVTVALAGAIALQLLFAGLGSRYTSDTGVAASRTGTLIRSSSLDAAGRDAMAQRFRHALGSGAVEQAADAVVGNSAEAPSVSVVVADCAALRRIAHVPECRPGSAYRSRITPAVSGRPIHLGGATGPVWRAPTGMPEVQGLRDLSGAEVVGTLLLTPQALGRVRIPAAAVVALVPNGSPVLAPLVAQAVALDPALQVTRLSTTQTERQFDAVRRGLSIGLLLVMLLIGGVLLVSIGESLRERRRPLAVLAAIGTPRATMVRSILLEAALPVVVGSALAVATGTILGAALLGVLGTPVAAVLPTVGLAVATAIVVPLVVTVLSLPAAARLMRPEGLRTE